MMPYNILASAILCASPMTSINFQKINTDSLEKVEASLVGYTSRSTSAILARMRNGDSVNILYDKDAGLSPMAYRHSKNKVWLTEGNPYWSEKTKKCEELLCSLPDGLCKCSYVIDDSEYTFSTLSDSIAGGCMLTSKTKFVFKAIPGRKEKRKVHMRRYLPEKEMKDRFLRNPGLPIRIDE